MKRDDCGERLSVYVAGELQGVEAAELERLAAERPERGAMLEAMRRVAALTDGLADPDLPQAARLRVLAAARTQTDPPPAAPEVMTPDELAGFLRVSPEELDEVIEEIPGFDVAGRLRFRRERVETWMAERERLRENEILFGQLEQDRALGMALRAER